MKKLSLFALAGAGVLGLAMQAQAITIYANNAAPGDAYTNASGSNQGQAVVGSDWYYNNVRNSGIVGINTQYPRSGDGSVRLQTTLGPGGASSKADVELLVEAVNFGGNYFSTGALGRLENLTALSYDWYRSSSSTNSAVQHPVLRLLLDADGDLNTITDRGGLVFELAYNGSVVPTDTWVTTDVFNFYGPDMSANLWNFGLGVGNEFGGYNKDLSEWIAGFSVGQVSSPLSGDSLIIGISAGVGSGWGPFDGGVDNITIAFAEQEPITYNFEVSRQVATQPIPEPVTAVLGAMGVLALAGSMTARSRRQA